MASSKLSPRQKMINLMYLVLTVLLAMNVSREVLNAFQIVGDGIQTSNVALQERNLSIYSTFDKIAANDTTQTILELYALSLKTKSETERMLDYISTLQDELRLESGTENVNGTELFKQPDDVEAGTRLLTQDNNGIIKGAELRLELLDLRKIYLEIVEEGNKTVKGTGAYKDYKAEYASIIPLKEMPETLIGQDKREKQWQDFNFYQVPVIATDVILSKLKNDIIASETQILQYLKDQMSIEMPDFDVLTAKVIAPKSYLANGHIYESEIFLAASSSKSEIEVFVGQVDKMQFIGLENGVLFSTNEDLPFKGSYKQLEVENGKAKFETLTSGVGAKSYEGVVRMKKPNGGYEIYPFESDYEVAPPSGVSVAPTKMNVLYIGVDNPISITVGGTKSDEDVYASINQGSITKDGNGKYTARVTSTGEANINVQALVNDQMQNFSPMVFRVKRVPDPVITLCGGSAGGNINLNTFKACGGLVAKTIHFDFEAHFVVESYTMRVVKNATGPLSNENQGPGFDDKSDNLKNALQTGDIVYFDNIVVRDPANEKRSLNQVVKYTIRN